MERPSCLGGVLNRQLAGSPLVGRFECGHVRSDHLYYCVMQTDYLSTKTFAIMGRGDIVLGILSLLYTYNASVPTNLMMSSSPNLDHDPLDSGTAA